MDEQQARTLKPGDIVTFDSERSDCAEVKNVTATSLILVWLDSGMVGVYWFTSPVISHLELWKGQ